MLLVSDVHGAFDRLEAVARLGEPLFVLGDFLNFIDYRTHEGLLADVAGTGFVAEMTRLRDAGDFAGSRRLWTEFRSGREDELAAQYEERIDASYAKVASALGDSEAYVTYGNVDRPDRLRRALPPTARFLDGDVVEVEGVRVGVVGGGVRSLGVPGEVDEGELAAKLERVGEVDVLCTHAAPAIRPLSKDVIGGRLKESPAVLAHIERTRPRWHYFGDIHQPQASTWRVGPTTCINVGYFRATGRPVRHG